MPKKCRSRQPFDKQHGKRTQALLKSAPHHLYLIHWSLPKQLIWKKLLLLKCQILGLLVNTLAADEKYPALNKDNLTIPIQIQFSLKQKFFSELFAAFLESMWNFECFEKEMGFIAFLFLKLWTLKTWLDKWLKNPIPEDPLTNNIVNLPKYCSNLHHKILIFFNGHCQVNWVGKIPLIDMKNLGTAC